jgi:hypothetical protein
MLSVMHAQCHKQAVHAGCQYAECPYAVFRYSER